MTAANQEVARIFRRIADLFQEQGASDARVGLWRAGAEAAAADRLDLAGALAGVADEVQVSGHTRVLDRLAGDISAVDLLAEMPGLGPCLVRRIHRRLGIDTLEELAEAARDGRLMQVPGFGERRVHTVLELIASRPGLRSIGAPPPVPLVLVVDRRFREGAAAGTLPRIVPRHAQSGEARVPILHMEHDGWHFTALFAATPLARRLGRAHDWVVVYHDREGAAGRSTVVTETEGPLAGRRVVRGRERESAISMVQETGAVVARM
jgi:hypothetical protein